MERYSISTTALRGGTFAFSPTAECLALLTTDGKLRIFETGAAASRLGMYFRWLWRRIWEMLPEYSESQGSHRSAFSAARNEDGVVMVSFSEGPLHFAVPCYEEEAFIGQKGEDRPFLLVGSSYGVEGVDVQTGEVAWRLKHEGGVTAIAADVQSQNVFFCSMTNRSGGRLEVNKGTVLETFKAGKHRTKHLLVLEGLNKVFIAGSQLLLWDAVQKKKIVKYAGHATDVCAIAASPLGSYVLSAAEDERQVTVWRTEKKEKNAVCLLSMDHSAIHLDTEVLLGGADAEASFVALAISEIGVVYIWQCKQDAQNVLQSTLWAKIHVKTQNAKDITDVVLSAKLRNLSDQISVVVVHGNAALPRFESVSLSAIEDSPLVIELETAASTVFRHGSQPSAVDGKKKRKREVTVIGADNGIEAIQMVHSSQPAAESSLSVPDIKNTVPPSTGSTKEMTLGERLQQLEKKMDKVDDEVEATAKKSSSLSASSAAVLIHQINQSGDMELYNRAMRLPPDIQASTAKQLSSHDAAQFLHRCSERLQLKPKDAFAIIGWIRAILKFHAAYLMSSPDAQKSISRVYQMIETRLAMFDSLMALSGRIDLLLAQVEQKEKMKEPLQETVPQVTVEMDMSDDEAEFEELEYDEGDEETQPTQESEMEDARMAGSPAEETSDEEA